MSFWGVTAFKVVAQRLTLFLRVNCDHWIEIWSMVTGPRIKGGSLIHFSHFTLTLNFSIGLSSSSRMHKVYSLCEFFFVFHHSLWWNFCFFGFRWLWFFVLGRNYVMWLRVDCYFKCGQIWVLSLLDPCLMSLVPYVHMLSVLAL